MPFRLPRPFALLAATLVLAFAAAGCDSSDDDGGSNASATTVQFGAADLSVLEASSPTLELPVTISNPPGEEVTVEVLFAAGASEGFSLADLGLSAGAGDEDAFYDEDGNLSGYVVGTVTFPADAEDGATRTLAPLDLADDVVEDQEVGVFALQRARTASGAEGAVAVGAPSDLTLTVQAEGTETLLEATFAGSELAPMTMFSVASNQGWVTGSRDDAPNSPYAEANGFGADVASNDWLISPALDFAGVGEETLTFLNAKNFDDGGLPTGLRVLVSTDYSGSGDPTAADWTDVTDRATYSEGNYEFVASGEVDLSDDAFQSEETYVAFQYQTSGTGAGSSELWRVDDIVITGQGAAGGGDDDGDDGDDGDDDGGA